MMEGDLEIIANMMWEKLTLLTGKISLSITRTENIGISMLEVSKFK